MTDVPFTDEQMGALRVALGFGEHDREVTADDLIAVLDARQVVNDGERAWLDGDCP